MTLQYDFNGVIQEPWVILSYDKVETKLITPNIGTIYPTTSERVTNFFLCLPFLFLQGKFWVKGNQNRIIF